MDLANHGLIKEALRRNQHIRPADVEHYFFSVLDVYPADCSPKGHSRVDRRVSDMQLVAQAADQEELAKALEARREFLRGTRARLDAYQICLDDGPGRRRRWDPWARRRGR